MNAAPTMASNNTLETNSNSTHHSADSPEDDPRNPKPSKIKHRCGSRHLFFFLVVLTLLWRESSLRDIRTQNNKSIFGVSKSALRGRGSDGYTPRGAGSLWAAAAQGFQLPSIEEAEFALPLHVQAGRAYLAAAIEQLNKAPMAPSDAAAQAMAVLATAVSQGRTEQLVGIDIRLMNLVALQFASVPVSRTFTVTQFLGNGAANAVVEVMEKRSQERFAMRIVYSPYQPRLTTSRMAAFGEAAMMAELRMMIRACGRTPPRLAAARRGVAVALGTAEIAGLPQVIFSGSMFVYRHVQIMERLHGDLGHLLYSKTSLPIEAKEYIARRILLQVLHLQEARVSHNDLKWSNFFVREDGSFLLGDFGSSTQFGKTLKNQFTDVTPAYGEPELLIDLRKSSSADLQPMPVPKSDMWSLGVMLHELFMDGSLPYGIGVFGHSMVDMSDYSNTIVSSNVSPNALVAAMDRHRVPPKWKILICKLLEPRRSQRISSFEVKHYFRALFLDEK